MRIVMLIAALFVAGCIPPPQAKTTMLDATSMAVSAKGQYVHDNGEVTQAILKESARQALKRGYEYFQVVQSADRSSTGLARSGPGIAAPYTIPAGEMIVRFYKEPPNAPNVWNAQEVLGLR
jgi:hypothetical protein